MQYKKNWFIIEIDETQTNELNKYLNTIYIGNRYTEYSFEVFKSTQNVLPMIHYYINADGHHLSHFILKRFKITPCEMPAPPYRAGQYLHPLDRPPLRHRPTSPCDAASYRYAVHREGRPN